MMQNVPNVHNSGEQDGVVLSDSPAQVRLAKMTARNQGRRANISGAFLGTGSAPSSPGDAGEPSRGRLACAVVLIVGAGVLLLAARSLTWFHVSPGTQVFTLNGDLGYSQIAHSLQLRELGQSLGVPVPSPSPITRWWFEAGLDSAIVALLITLGAALSRDLRYMLWAVFGLVVLAGWFAFSLLNMHSFLTAGQAVANPSSGATSTGIGIVLAGLALVIAPSRTVGRNA